MATTTTSDSAVLGTGVNDSNMAFACSTTSTPSWPTLTEQIYTTTTTTTMDPTSFLDHSHHHHHHYHQQQQQHSFPQMVAPLTPDMQLITMHPSSPSESCSQVMDTAGCCAFGSYEATPFSMDSQAPPGYKSEMMLPPTPEVCILRVYKQYPHLCGCNLL